LPIIFQHGELYASAALLGTLALIGLQETGLAPVATAWSTMAIILAARLLSMAFVITLPTYRERR